MVWGGAILVDRKGLQCERCSVLWCWWERVAEGGGEEVTHTLGTGTHTLLESGAAARNSGSTQAAGGRRECGGGECGRGERDC
jgi:hypothetical protein